MQRYCLFLKHASIFMPTFSHLFPEYTLFNNHTKMNIHAKNIQNVRKPHHSFVSTFLPDNKDFYKLYPPQTNYHFFI